MTIPTPTPHPDEPDTGPDTEPVPPLPPEVDGADFWEQRQDAIPPGAEAPEEEHPVDLPGWDSESTR